MGVQIDVTLAEIIQTAYENGYARTALEEDGNNIYVKFQSGYYLCPFGNKGKGYDGTPKDFEDEYGIEEIYERVAEDIKERLKFEVEAKWILECLKEIKENNYNTSYYISKEEYDKVLDEWIDRTEFAMNYRDADDKLSIRNAMTGKELLFEQKVNDWIDKTFQEKGYIINPDIDFSKDLVPESDDLFYEGNEETHTCDFEFQTESMDMNKIFPDFYNYITTYFEDIDTYSYMNFYANLSEKDSPSIDLTINFETNKINAHIPMTEKQFDDLRKVLTEYREQEEQEIER